MVTCLLVLPARLFVHSHLKGSDSKRNVAKLIKLSTCLKRLLLFLIVSDRNLVVGAFEIEGIVDGVMVFLVPIQQLLARGILRGK